MNNRTAVKGTGSTAVQLLLTLVEAIVYLIGLVLGIVL